MRTNWIAISVGGAAGFLSAALVAVLFWAVLALLGVAEPVTTGIVGGVVSGLFVAGYVAGRISTRAVFHGSFTAVLAAAGITILAFGEGSPASAPTVAGFIAGAGVIGGVGGFAAARRQAKESPTDNDATGVS